MLYIVEKPDPNTTQLPILISAPHVGIEIPNNIVPKLQAKYQTNPEDTDWFVHKLYSFSKSLGITLIRARYSRYVVDLNRPEKSKKLYSDGRPETGVVPTTAFSGEDLYKEAPPDDEEKAARIETYHRPYYAEITRLLAEMRKEHRNVLFFDAHSIRRLVPRIQTQPFPDLILGDRDMTTASPLLAKQALSALKKGGYEVNHNTPFKGGNLTQHFGQPDKGIHALQLEKSQDIYMADCLEPTLDKEKTARLSALLEETIMSLIPILKDLP